MKYGLLITDYTGKFESNSIDELAILAEEPYRLGHDITIIEIATDNIVWLNGEYV